MHAKPDLRVILKWMIARSGSVITAVIPLDCDRMKISTGRTDYSQLQQEICGLHLGENDNMLDREFEQLKTRFNQSYPALEQDEDFEFTDWHSNLRMLWVYLYSDKFYNPDLLSNTFRLIESMESPWFFQFECYSKSIESNTNQTGSIGCFLVYKDSVIFNGNPEWDLFVKRIAG